MRYLKILDGSGGTAAVEAIADPVYVRTQLRTGRVLRCAPPQAQGVLDAGGGKIYHLRGKAPVPPGRGRGRAHHHGGI